MDMFSFTRFCLRVLAGLNENIRRMKRKVILTIAIKSHWREKHSNDIFCQERIRARTSELSIIRTPILSISTNPCG
jgi:hypothetical protein